MGETCGMNIAALAPDLRGRLTADAPLAPFTWFRAREGSFFLAVLSHVIGLFK